MTAPVAARARAALWAVRAAGQASRQVRRRRLEDVQLASPPAMACEEAIGAVLGVLGLTRRSCLVRSLVLQRWQAAYGVRRDLIVGVTAPREGFAAHAWLEGDDLSGQRRFTALVRYSPPSLR